MISVSGSTGASLGIDTYDEYGKPAASNIGRFQYTGQMWLPELGAYHYKARTYLPHLGVFAQTDPAGYADSPNLYAYVGGDPISFTDPFGLTTCTGGRLCGHDQDVADAELRAQLKQLGYDPRTANFDELLDFTSGVISSLEASVEIASLMPRSSEETGDLFHYASDSANGSTAYIPSLLYESYQKGFLTGNFVGAALANDPFHEIARNRIVLQNAVNTGTMFYISSMSGFFPSILLQANFGYAGRMGVIEYIMPQNRSFFFGTPEITHARFVPNAPISGHPNNDRGLFGPFPSIGPA